MEAFAEYLGGTQFEVKARGHRVVCDLPGERHGTDRGMMPPELLLGALASCAAYYAVEYLKMRGLDSGEVRVRVAGEKVSGPARLDSFRIEVAAGALDERHRAGLLRAVQSCPIHNTLLGSPKIDIALTPVHSEADTTVGTGHRS